MIRCLVIQKATKKLMKNQEIAFYKAPIDEKYSSRNNITAVQDEGLQIGSPALKQFYKTLVAGKKDYLTAPGKAGNGFRRLGSPLCIEIHQDVVHDDWQVGSLN